MKLLQLTGLIATCVILTGCGFIHDERLTGSYRLIAVDVMEQMSVCRDGGGRSAWGRIDETVFAVGWDARYILAKQHPANNRSVTNFYYLEMARDRGGSDTSHCVTGPLTEAEFNQRKAELKLPEFRRVIEQLD